ncbi:hypothetical protein [Boudabousia marimammalium]|uniref:Polyphosphate kinase-2-related domain-containing protein n=1 Tax=Boudabousia marimammalium TaxID=156892 RepID=A0A1Q5PSG7_9ACTO|nr:hypothetical protein [Boudabousia marimammalium]OKL50350.1 hypothetical protein BM477_02925 [Boudabousia marimammalium]
MSGPKEHHKWALDPRAALRVGEGFDLSTFDYAATPGWEGDKKSAKAFRKNRDDELDTLQSKLYAQGLHGGNKAILIVVEGAEASGAGRLVRHLMATVDPMGVHLCTEAKPAPTGNIAEHIEDTRDTLPGPGMITFLHHSYYRELRALVKTGAPLSQIQEYGAMINQFEQELVDGGYEIIKLCLLLSQNEQGRRLMKRLTRPDLRWRWSELDLQMREHCHDTDNLYQTALGYTSTNIAPWLAVPSDEKWYPRLVLTEVLARTLEDMNLEWPEPDFDLDAAKQRLALTMPPFTSE